MLIDLNGTLGMNVFGPMVLRRKLDCPGLILYRVLDNDEQTAPAALNQSGSKRVAKNGRRNNPRENGF